MFTNREEKYLLDSLEEIKRETHENNIMLSQIIKVLNAYISRHGQENMEDFGRNVLANVISELGFKRLK